MELTTNEIKIRLSGTANIPKDLELGKSYDLTIGGVEVRSKEEHPNDDGSSDVVYKLAISELSETNIISDNGIIPAKKFGSQARVLRVMIERLAEQQNLDPEAYYQERMIGIIDQIKNELD